MPQMARRTLRFCVTAGLLLAAAAPGVNAWQGANGSRLVEPSRADNARVELSFEKPTFFLGENVMVHYCVENASATPFGISVGGDYQGASRSTRFRVTVTDANGTVIPDPDSAASSLGGISIAPTLSAGARWCQSLPLMRYARIDEPGTYTVRVTHDLGWTNTPAPEGRASVELVMPTADEAARVLTEALALPPAQGLVMNGQKSASFRDLSTLRSQVYLPALIALARAGSREAIAGIGAIPTPDATRALIALLDRPDRALALDAAQTLAMRMPDPALDGTLPRRSPFGRDVEDVRRGLRDAAWRPDMAPDVRRIAAMWLASQDAQEVIQGAFMIGAVGEVDNAPALAAALDHALERTLTLPLETGSYPRPRGAMLELMRAADAIVARGYVPPVVSVSPGQAALWLAAFKGGARFTDWHTHLRDLLAHPIPYVRELALQQVPADAPQDLFSAVAPALQSGDMDLQIAACQLVERARLKTYRESMADIVRHATDFMVMNAARNALYVVGGRAAVMDIAADQVADPSKLSNAIGGLFGVFEGTAGFGGGPVSATEAEALSARWKTFIAAHRAAIDAGQRFGVDDPAVTPDLIPSGWTIRRAVQTAPIRLPLSERIPESPSPVGSGSRPDTPVRRDQ